MEKILRHIKTHAVPAMHDQRALAILEYKLSECENFACQFLRNDKTPNIDGRFELVIDPTKSRQPQKSFCVQIKGVEELNKLKSGYSYCLDDLAFPAYVASHITDDPGILFIVEKATEKVFWVHISNKFLDSIDFDKDSKTIRLSDDNHVDNIEEFIMKLDDIIKAHTILQKLDWKEYTQEEVDRIIKQCDDYICEHIAKFDVCGRDKISQNILLRLRVLCEAVMLRVCNTGNIERSIPSAYENLILDKGYNFLCRFLRNLYHGGFSCVPEDGQAERLMLKYYDYLWEIRDIFRKNFSREILSNLEDFPLQLVQTEDLDFYQKVAIEIDASKGITMFQGAHYYVKRKKRFYINGKRYFEIVLELANIYATKFDRVTVFSSEDIPDFYSVRVKIATHHINIWNKSMPIKIITDWRVSIVPASLNKFAAIFDKEQKLSSRFGEYDALMDFLSETGANLVDIIDLPDGKFDMAFSRIYLKAKTRHFAEILKEVRKYAKFDVRRPGSNILRYLLFGIREDIIDLQFDQNKCGMLSGLRLTTKSISFDRTPFTFSLRGHNPRTFDLMQCIPSKGRNADLLASRIINNTETKAELYTQKDTLSHIKNIDDLVQEYNSKLWKEQKEDNKIVMEGDLLYVNDYEKTTLKIIEKLKGFSSEKIQGHRNAITKWLGDDPEKVVDCIDKRNIMLGMFENSCLAMIYGSAGTGKTKLMDYISNFFHNKRKVFLANTNTAVDNLRRRITNPGSPDNIMTIAKFLANQRVNVDIDVLFIDECSTVNNRDMLKILGKANATLLVLAGDIYQIESIRFGNWFKVAKELLPSNTIAELELPWRAKDNKNLQKLWAEVRVIGENIHEELAFSRGKFSKSLDESILVKEMEDEIILCLNYDGLYGINNINRYLQLANPEKAVEWRVWTYKVGDRILFNESRRFPSLYNNLKGKIIEINKHEDEYKISFKVEVEVALTSLDVKRNEFSLNDSSGGKSVIEFVVYENPVPYQDDTDENMAKLRTIVPFQIAYAVSIHKSQGLEYDSVKIVITHDMQERITHNIFYTAITRAKEKLRIFWSPETQDNIIKKFKPLGNSIDKEILRGKLSKNQNL